METVYEVALGKFFNNKLAWGQFHNELAWVQFHNELAGAWGQCRKQTLPRSGYIWGFGINSNARLGSTSLCALSLFGVFAA